jgi:hypothetical protein
MQSSFLPSHFPYIEFYPFVLPMRLWGVERQFILLCLYSVFKIDERFKLLIEEVIGQLLLIKFNQLLIICVNTLPS